MKIIDLLNKIAKGEEVSEKIKWHNVKFKYNIPTKDYWDEEGDELFNLMDGINLNDEIEIIEKTKKIEKIKDEIDVYEDSYYDTALLKLAGKIDEIIDYINRGDKDEI